MTFRIILLLITIFCLMLQSGCGYHTVSAKSGSMDYGHTIWVDFIGNTTVSSTAQTVIRRATTDEFHALRSLIPATSRDNSDIKISGLIKSYYIRVVSYTSSDMVREYRLTVEAEFEVTSKTSQKPLWKGVLNAYQDFPASDPLHLDLAKQKNAEEAALIALSRKLAHSLITSMEESY